MSTDQAHATESRSARKTREGYVVSDKMEKTVVVSVTRRTIHPRYGKTVTRSKNYKAHDESDEVGVGDRVRITETRPLSKSKRWRVDQVLERAK